MAFGSNSKVFASFLTDLMNKTNALDLNSDTLKVAIYNNTGTPDNTDTSAHNAYAGVGGAWAAANEAANGGWSTGGLALASVTSGFASNVYTLDAADTANGSAATIADTRGCLVYDTNTTPLANQGISFHSFGGLTAVTAGTLTIVWNASGLFTFTLT